MLSELDDCPVELHDEILVQELKTRWWDCLHINGQIFDRYGLSIHGANGYSDLMAKYCMFFMCRLVHPS